ncbi:hypothetical protein [Pedobacter mucosus]|uniref:hypothetical protein n=1 Tax=Pedobacter mucosus TaxID=2895286 RepID=UPI001EE4DF6D|nr:hypothetical protein [Pedobacter mucosus]UKT63057.1 hypothetical protein LOK61_14920 [Pedobacter mucosus]
MSEKKTNKISYKTYPNDRLKEVDFHGVATHPLYIQVTYDRKSIFFKSYYFELFGKARYLLKIPGITPKGPSLGDCVEREEQVIRFILEKHREDFTLDLFRSAYLYYSRDLCDIFQDGFIDYLYTFFWDDGYPALGDAVLYGSKDVVAYELIRSLKRAFKPELFIKLKENSLYYAPPYLPIYEFMAERHRWPQAILTVMEMEDPQTLKSFGSFLIKRYTEDQAVDILNQVAKWHKYS